MTFTLGFCGTTLTNSQGKVMHQAVYCLNKDKVTLYKTMHVSEYSVSYPYLLGGITIF